VPTRIHDAPAVGPAAREKRTVLGHWPILLSLAVALQIAARIGIAVLSPDPSADGAVSRWGVTLVPIAVLIGLSVTCATYLPQTKAGPWVRHVAMWASFVAVVVVAANA
jgi:hypothetical protein